MWSNGKKVVYFCADPQPEQVQVSTSWSLADTRAAGGYMTQEERGEGRLDMRQTGDTKTNKPALADSNVNSVKEIACLTHRREGGSKIGGAAGPFRCQLFHIGPHRGRVKSSAPLSTYLYVAILVGEQSSIRRMSAARRQHEAKTSSVPLHAPVG